MDPRIYYLIHVLSIILLTGSVFYIAANPQKHKKKKYMSINGILSVLALVGGFGLMAKLYGNDFSQGWVIVKIVAWLLITALAGMAFKKPKAFTILALSITVAIAVFMVYFRPF